MKEATLEEQEAELARREAVLDAERKALDAEREALRAEQAAIEAAKLKAMRESVEAETGSTHFPEAFRSRLWSYAWQEGHAYGEESVADQYRELARMMDGFEVSLMK